MEQFKNIEQAKPWEDRKSENFRNWISVNALADPSEWDEDFREYIHIKQKEREQELPTWDKYLNGFNLSEEDLRGKKILDLGCLDGEFVRACIDRGITQEAYGVDKELEGEAKGGKYSGHFFQQKFEDNLPDKDFDYVLSYAAISLALTKELAEMGERAIKEALSVIKDSGEVRIGPIGKVYKGSELLGIAETMEILESLLQKISKEEDIEWELIPIDISATGDQKDVWLDQVLILRRKEYKQPM